jgi:hypothetical protein
VFANNRTPTLVLHGMRGMNSCIKMQVAGCGVLHAGLGVVQALPGPLFNFSAYLGAIIAVNAGYNFMLGATLAWLGLFAPGVMIIFGE